MSQTSSIYIFSVKNNFIFRFEDKLKVRNQSSLGKILQILILTTSSFKRIPNRIKFLWILINFVYLNFLCLQQPNIRFFRRCDKHQSPPFTSKSGSTTYSMNVSFNVLRDIHLNNPINLWKV